MITGYFYTDIKTGRSQNKQLRKTIRLYIFAQGSYLLYEFFLGIIIKSRPLLNPVSPETIVKLLVTNETTPDSAHLWYLLALIYVLALARLGDDLINTTWKIAISVGLIIFSQILGIYSGFLLGKTFSELLTRNFLFMGIPYFLIGDIIRTQNNNKFKRSILIVLIMLLIILSIIEYHTISHHFDTLSGDVYLVTPFLSICVFLLPITGDGLSCLWLSQIGKRYSSLIYVSHIMIYELLSIITKKIGIGMMFNIYAPLIVFMVSLLYAFLWSRLKNIIRGWF